MKARGVVSRDQANNNVNRISINFNDIFINYEAAQNLIPSSHNTINGKKINSVTPKQVGATFKTIQAKNSNSS